MNKLLPIPLNIKRFKPVEILSFDPDAPVMFNNPLPFETLSTMEDVYRIANELYYAEEAAWKGERAREIIETVIDGATRDLLDVARYLERQDSPEATALHGTLMEIILRMKLPLVACVLESIEAIYIKCGEKKAREAVEKLLKEVEERK